MVVRFIHKQKIIVSFKNQSSIKDLYSNTLSVSSAILTPNKYHYRPSSMSTAIVGAAAVAAKSLSYVLVGTSLLFSQSIGSMGPLIDFNQILNLIYSINLKVPYLTEIFNSKMSMVTSLNLNFTFTCPLFLIEYTGVFGRTTERFKRVGFNSISLVYNLQNQITSYSMIYILLKVILVLCNRITRVRSKFLLKIVSWLRNLALNANSMIVEMYYQQRMVTYFAVFLYLCSASEMSTLYGLMCVDMALVLAVLLLDHIFIYKWTQFTFNDKSKNKSLISFQNELHSIQATEAIRFFELCLMIFQIVIPLLLVIISYTWLQVSLLLMLFMCSLLNIGLRSKFKLHKKLLCCYFMNYLCLLLFTIVWAIANEFARVEDNVLCGWILSILSLFPILTTAVLYLPCSIKDMKDVLAKIFRYVCKKKEATKKLEY